MEKEQHPVDNGSEVEQQKKPVIIDKRKAEVWHKFEVERDKKTQKIVKSTCKFCSTDLKVTTNGGTSSMTKHLKTCNGNPDNIDNSQPKISVFKSSQSEVATVSKWQFNQTSIRQALAKMIVIDEQPFSYVERYGFRLFCSVAVPQFSLPSRFSVAKDIGKLFLSEMESLRNTLKCLKSRIDITTDCWTSVQNLNYMVLTAHFVDDNWRLHKRILNFQVMDSHKGKEIGKVLESCILKFEKAFKRMKQEDPQIEKELKNGFPSQQEDPQIEKELKNGFPSQQDWENAKSLSLCFKQFFDATKRMSGTLYVTANMHYHEILGVLASLLEWKQDKDPTIVRMGDEMRKKFDKYYGGFGKTNAMVLVAVALDPRYKMRFVKFSLKKIFPTDEEKVKEIYDEVYDVLKRLYDHYDNVATKGKNDASSSSHSKDNDGQNFVGVVKNKQMTKIYDEFYENDVEDGMDKSEFEEYLESPPEKLNSDSFEILKWWSDKCTTHKVLSSMAKDILAIPVSTVASESAFSTSGRVVDDFRSNLGVKTVETLICTQDWLRASNVCIDLEQLLDNVEKYEKDIGDTIDDAFGQNSK